MNSYAKGKLIWDELTSVLPKSIIAYIDSSNMRHTLEEIRIRAEQPVALFPSHRARNPEAPIVAQHECLELFERICHHSIYAWEEELRQGFITMRGGIRVGMAGKALIEGGSFRRLSNVTYFNIRIPHECIGCADSVMPYIMQNEGAVYSTLLVSHPGGGKTTMLRDIARQLSTLRHPLRVCIVDERSELAGSYQGLAQNDLGRNCDVLDACPKAIGIRQILRTMSPDVIITDEIGSQGDIDALLDAAYCGVRIMASVHGSHVYDFYRRPCFHDLVERGVFERIITISRREGLSKVESIADSSGNLLFKGA